MFASQRLEGALIWTINGAGQQIELEKGNTSTVVAVDGVVDVYDGYQQDQMVTITRHEQTETFEYEVPH